MPDQLEGLEQITLFRNLDESVIAELKSQAVIHNFPKKAVIVVEGDTSDSLYILLKGRVKLYFSNANGREMILNIAGPGYYFGELASISELPRSASIMTLEPSRCAIIPGAVFSHCFHTNSILATNLVHELTLRLQQTAGKLRIFAFEDVYGRLTQLLLELAVEYEGERVIWNCPNRQILASMIGASREMVGRIWGELETGAYLQKKGKHVYILRDFPAGW